MTTPTEQEALAVELRLIAGFMHDPRPRDAVERAAAMLRKLVAAREADREAMRMALESLRDGRDALQAQADAFHCAMRGYKPETHASMDAEVARADAAIKALEQRVGDS